MSNKIKIVQGGQYGSEAKGAVAAWLCQVDAVDYNVRTGATNAGHTVYYKGKPYAMQQLGTGWVNPNTELVLGAGALIDPVILARECDMVTFATGKDVRRRLLIDYRAGLHFPVHQERSKSSGRHHAIGATGKGCSEALIDRIRNRNMDNNLFGNTEYAQHYQVVDTEALLNNSHDHGATILLEGTQGQLLDLYLGPYPYTTHKQTGPAQWMLESGLSPSLPTEIYMVSRTFPIRVAGNSGPMPSEISWSILAGEINSKLRAKGHNPLIGEEALMVWENALEVAGREFPMPSGRTPFDQHMWTSHERLEFKETVSELNASAFRLVPPQLQQELRKLFELTTVTKKLRRIARWNDKMDAESRRQIRPHFTVLTFANYLFPQFWFRSPEPSEVTPEIRAMYDTHPIVSWGPTSDDMVDNREDR